MYAFVLPIAFSFLLKKGKVRQIFGQTPCAYMYSSELERIDNNKSS